MAEKPETKPAPKSDVLVYIIAPTIEELRARGDAEHDRGTPPERIRLVLGREIPFSVGLILESDEEPATPRPAKKPRADTSLDAYKARVHAELAKYPDMLLNAMELEKTIGTGQRARTAIRDVLAEVAAKGKTT